MLSFVPFIFVPLVLSASAVDAITNNYRPVSDYDLRRSDGRSSVTSMSHLDETLHLSFSAHGRSFVSHLVRNHDLYSDHAQLFRADGRPRAFRRAAYHGKVDGGYIRFSVLAPHRFHAMIKLANGDILIVDPADVHSDAAPHDTEMVAYRVDDITDTHVHHRVRQLIGETQYGRLRSCNYGGTNKVEIAYGIAADAGYVAKYGGVDGTENQISALFNTISALYADQLGVYMKLGAVKLYETTGGSSPSWNMKELGFSISSSGRGCANDGFRYNIDRQLDGFRAWVRSGQAPLCGSQDCGFWHLLTNCGEDRNRHGNVAGVAYVGTICQIRGNGAATGVSIDLRSQAWVVVGHEIGHNFGSSHSTRGIMSYDPNAIKKFYPENERMCSVIKANIGRCISEFKQTVAPVVVPDAIEEEEDEKPTEPPVMVVSTPAPTPDTTAAVRPTSRCVLKTPKPAPTPCSSYDRQRSLLELNHENRDLGSGPCACLSTQQLSLSCPTAAKHLCFLSPSCKETGLVLSAEICPSFRYRHRSVYDTQSVGTWKVSAWSTCSKACGPNGRKTRSIQCVNAQGQVLDESLCPGTKPEDATLAPCNTHSCTLATTDICQTPSFATCQRALGMESCVCACNSGFFYDDAFDSCRKTTVPTTTDDIFYVDTVDGLHSLECTEGSVGSSSTNHHAAGDSSTKSIGGTEIAVFVLAALVLVAIGGVIARNLSKRQNFSDLPQSKPEDFVRASILTL